MKYKILRGEYSYDPGTSTSTSIEQDLENKVNELLEKGWELHGAPISDFFIHGIGDMFESESVIYQAMVKPNG